MQCAARTSPPQVMRTAPVSPTIRDESLRNRSSHNEGTTSQSQSAPLFTHAHARSPPHPARPPLPLMCAACCDVFVPGAGPLACWPPGSWPPWTTFPSRRTPAHCAGGTSAALEEGQPRTYNSRTRRRQRAKQRRHKVRACKEHATSIDRMRRVARPPDPPPPFRWWLDPCIHSSRPHCSIFLHSSHLTDILILLGGRHGDGRRTDGGLLQHNAEKGKSKKKRKENRKRKHTNTNNTHSAAHQFRTLQNIIQPVHCGHVTRWCRLKKCP